MPFVRTLPAVISAIALLSAGMCPKLAAADLVELHLRSGAVVTGDLVSQDGEKVVVKSSMVGKSGKAMSITMTYKRDDIADLVDIGDPDAVYATRATTAKSAADHTRLAHWCAQMGMADKALEQAERAVDLDPAQDDAAKLACDAGWVKSAGTWCKEADVLASQGKVRYLGKVMTIGEADELKASAKRQAAAADALAAANDKSSTVAYDDKLIAELKKRAPLIDADLAKAQAAVAAAEATVPKLAAAKTAYDTAQTNLSAARANPPAGANTGTGGVNGQANSYLTPYTSAVDAAQKAYYAAKTDAANADAIMPSLKAKVGGLLNDKNVLIKKLEELMAKREAAARDQEQAKSDAAKAAAAAAATPATGATPAPGVPPATTTATAAP